MNAGRSWLRGTVLVLGLGLAACGDGTGPDDTSLSIAVRSGDGQFGGPSTSLLDPFEVVVTDQRRNEPAHGTRVTWRIVAGPGGTVLPETATTDSSGLASTRLTLGPDTGTFRVEASVRGAAEPAVFMARAVLTPEIQSIEPETAASGETVRLVGRNFSTVAGENTVLFGGFRGSVVSASATELHVTVPPCIPTRTVDVTVQLGPVASLPRPLQVLGGSTAPLELAVGQAATAVADLSCVRLPGGRPGIAFLVVPQNVTDSPDRDLSIQLAGLTGLATQPALLAPQPQPIAIAPLPAGSGLGEEAAAFEAELRAREHAIPPADAAAPAPAETPELRAAAVVPNVGDRREFNVINREFEFVTVTAEVKHVSNRAVLYQDLDAPAGGFTNADFADFGRLFDDPIHATTVGAYGDPSDIDANERVIILFTPVVNQMTDRGSDGFIAGFFYGLDLTTQNNSNRAEIFYSLVPDPDARFGDRRATNVVLTVVPPVLAHEFQHMIHFNERVLTRRVGTETLWLSEALAHMAEDLVGDVLLARGEDATADRFRISNYARSNRYLADPAASSLIGPKPPGTLAERGAQWLFIKYLMGHYGGTDLLRRLTQSTRSSVSNVTAETGMAWSDLLTDWAVALWATEAPELQGVQLPARLRFVNFELRTELARFKYAVLQPPAVPFEDFLLRDTILASTAGYVIVQAGGTNPKPLHLGMGARFGAAFPPDARPQLTLLRIR